jgi:glutamyl-tRNA synthetase
MTATGRWAPSPTGDLHLGNLRTALLAWLFARSVGGRFVWRFEDLDGAVRDHFYATQLADVAALGITWDGPELRQRDRVDNYTAALADLAERDLTYPCWCTRKEIREATSAPHHHLAEGAYPGTCRELTRAQIAERERSGRPPAIRLRANDAQITIEDRLLGEHRGTVDDVVLRRGDGAAAYNLTVVIDDAHQGVTEVVRGSDLLSSTPRQALIAELLGVGRPSWAHVPMALSAAGQRLAKRDGAVTLADRLALGQRPVDVLNLLLGSLDLPTVGSIAEIGQLIEVFDPDRLPTEPWIVT